MHRSPVPWRYLAGFAGIVVSVAVFAPTLNHVFASPVLFEPADGTAYFGFTFRSWESADPAVGDTRPFAERYQDALARELGGRAPTLLGVPTIWQNADGSAVPFSSALNQINLYQDFNGGKSVALLSWSARTGWGADSSSYAGITTQTILQGSLDGYIRQYARDVKAYGKPLFIRLICGEANGTWWHNCSPGANPSLTKADFSNAGRHVVDLFRGEGVTNVAWVWNMNTFPAPPADWGTDTDIESYYPGDAYVDWVGADHYDYGDPAGASTKPLNVAQYLDPHYEFAVTHGKPFFLAEWGVRHSGSRLSPLQHQQWLNAMFDYIESHPRIKAVLYFNYNMNTATQEDAAHMSGHVWLYDNTVNFHPNVNNNDHRLLAETGADLRGPFASRIQNNRYLSDVAVNNARFVSQTAPLTMTGGMSYTVAVIMRNTGTGTVWTRANGYKLQSLNPTDTLAWGVNRVEPGSGDVIGPAAAEALAASPHAAGLRALDLANTWTGVEGTLALAGSPHMAGLGTLNLPNSRVYHLGVEALAASPHLTGLWHLNLSDNGFGSDMLLALAGSAALANVRSLQLRGGSPGSVLGLRALADGDRFPALTRLDLSANRITDAGLAILLRWPGLSRLTHLLLGENRITDQGAVALAGNASLAGLIALDLHHNGIADAGAPHLVNVRWLSLVKNRNISHPTRAHLKQQLDERIDIR